MKEEPSLCLICSSPFKKKTKTHVYCSAICRDKAKYKNPYFKQIRRERHQSWSSRNIDSRRDYHYRTRFGITLAEYEEMFVAQGKVCAVCGKEKRDSQKAFAVDHDHVTGEIFGILCTPCNHRLIGETRDPVLFEKAAAYLRKGTGRYVPEKFKKPKRKRKRRVRKQ